MALPGKLEEFGSPKSLDILTEKSFIILTQDFTARSAQSQEKMPLRPRVLTLHEEAVLPKM
jgi:hypothetical protein